MAITKAQREALESVCRSNGGGISIRCAVEADGTATPKSPAFRKLFELGLIQGKSNSYATVVHTREGLALFRQLQGEQS